MNKRPGWDEYFMRFAHLARTRSTCLRRSVGAVLVKDKNILATGYNGAPRDVPHCADVGCLRAERNVPSGQMHELCRGLHAEQNAIIQAAYHGVSIRNADLYSTTFPCIICTKMLINAGVKRIFYEEGYPDDLSAQMLEQAGITLIHLSK
ncbi:MAG: deoxycytidylate deaminase [Alphaproteobacteria bacterium]